MSKEEQKTPVEQPKNAGGVNGEKNDFVEYGSYKKVLDEKKSVQSKMNSLQAELESLREEKMKRDGKSDELIETYRKKIADLEGDLSGTKKNFAWRTLTGEIKREASKHGCTNPDKLIKLMDDADLKLISENIGGDFSIDADVLKDVVEKSKKENDFLFKETTKKIANGTPKTKIVDEKKDLSKLSLEELKAMHKETYK